MTSADRGSGIPPARVVQVVGWSGSGKTHLLERVIPRLEERGLVVAVIKHSGGFPEMDQPGKDSFRLRRAGARRLVLTSQERSVVFFDHGGEQLGWRQWIDLLAGTRPDLILLESFSDAPLPKIEVFRAGGRDPNLRAGGDPHLAAVVSDDPVPGCAVEVIPSAEIERIAALLLEIAVPTELLVP